jgi:light-regulated signal transduction histidine kinase (bacteriophytochrome)
MDMMVLDLLEFSRVGRVRDALGEVSLAEVISTAVENLRLPIEESGASVSIPPDLPVITGSNGELIRLMQNLIGNAVKYRQPDRPLVITISTDRGDSGWTFTIADNGIGIAPDYFERIFDIFQRLHSRAEYEGTGIGLAVCKRIVERHQGSITVESEIGKGSVFRVILPAG